MTNAYPVQLDVASPPRFHRMQLLVRLALSIVLGWFGITAGWLVCVLFGVLPLIAAIAISTIGAVRYREEVVPRVWRALAWLLGLWAYMAVLVDAIPATPERAVHTSVRPTGTPTIGSSLLRLLTSIPSGIVLAVVWCAGAILVAIAALFVLFSAEVPASLLGFQRGILRWNARLVAYHASIVEEYPPFLLDTDDSPHRGVDRWSEQQACVGELRT